MAPHVSRGVDRKCSHCGASSAVAAGFCRECGQAATVLLVAPPDAAVKGFLVRCPACGERRSRAGNDMHRCNCCRYDFRHNRAYDAQAVVFQALAAPVAWNLSVTCADDIGQFSGEHAFSLPADVTVVRGLPDMSPVVQATADGIMLFLPDPGVSRRHCKFLWRGGRLSCTDLGSSNGTFLGGHRIPVGDAVSLSGQSCIALGEWTVLAWTLPLMLREAVS